MKNYRLIGLRESSTHYLTLISPFKSLGSRSEPDLSPRFFSTSDPVSTPSYYELIPQPVLYLGTTFLFTFGVEQRSRAGRYQRERLQNPVAVFGTGQEGVGGR
jgi:hypothetical protein